MLDFTIIGAGQSGLAIGYYLQKAGYSFQILDSHRQVGASWLKRWDSLKLFTPTEFNHLPGYKFDLPKGYYPDKYEVARYLQEYVAHFKFDIQLETLVQSLNKKENCFEINTSKGTFVSKQVIVATGPFHTAFIPKFANKISAEVLQIHSKNYRSPNQLNQGKTLVVGAGDSGVQILDEISRTGMPTYFSGKTTAAAIPQEFLGKTLWWWFEKTGFLSVSKNSLIGKYVSKKMQPIIGTDLKGVLNRKNVKSVGRSLDANEDTIIFEDEEIKDIKNIIWATGFRPSYSWIKNIALDKDGYPINERGISPIKGLFFIGLPWMHTRGSATLGGVKKDAAYLIEHITKYCKADKTAEVMFIRKNEPVKEQID